MAAVTRKERWAIWYAENRSCVLARKKAYRAKKKKEISLKAKIWRQANPDKVKKYSKERQESGRGRRSVDKYQLRNPEKVKASHKRWLEQNPNYLREYSRKNAQLRRVRDRERRAENPEKDRVRVRNRRARLKWSGGTHSADDIAAIFKAQCGKCAYSWCRRSLRCGYHVDHILAVSRGGSNAPANLQLLCEECNQRKGAKDAIQFARQNGCLL